MKITIKFINFIMKLICLIMIFSVSLFGEVYAEEINLDTPLIETSKMTKLKIYYKDNNIKLKDVSFNLYKVASVSDVFHYTTINEFANYPVVCNGLKTAEQWRDLVITLSGYVSKDGIKPLIQKKTDNSGIIEFNNLDTGLYLVIGESKEIGITKWTPAPFMVSLPNLNINNEWEYELEVEPKFAKFDDIGRLYNKNVLVVWNDKGYEFARPKMVTIKLYRESEVQEEKTLSQKNNWSYTFENLDNKYTYKLVEDEINGYTISISNEGETYTITNTYITPSNKEKPSDDSLPKTGQSWWIIPILLALGIIFIILGYIFDKGNKIEDATKQ